MFSLIVPTQSHFRLDLFVAGILSVFGCEKAEAGDMQAFDALAQKVGHGQNAGVRGTAFSPHGESEA